MKKYYLLAMLLLVWTVGVARAEQVKTGSVSTSDTVAVQQGVLGLAKLFEVEPPKKAEPIQANPAPQKNIADVMDKAIDKVSDVVGAMAQAIKNIAPDVWRIMITQQYAKAVADLVVPVVTVLIFIGAFIASRARYNYVVVARADPDNKEEIDSDEVGLMEFLKFASVVAIALACFWLANRISSTALLLINPEYYAIQDLLRMILNKGQ